MHIDDSSLRAEIIGQNGEMAEEVYAAIYGAPSWDYAPEWAMWLAQDANGDWTWYEERPCIGYDEDEWFADNFKRAKDGLIPSPLWRNTLQHRPAKDAK